jgi:predicted site-specific integrase-resolvase
VLAENDKEDLITDMVAMVYSLTARLLDNVGQKAKWNASSPELQTEEHEKA